MIIIVVVMFVICSKLLLLILGPIRLMHLMMTLIIEGVITMVIVMSGDTVVLVVSSLV